MTKEQLGISGISIQTELHNSGFNRQQIEYFARKEQERLRAEQEYAEAQEELRSVYDPLQKKYNLLMNQHHSLYKDSLIEIFVDKKTYRERIIRVKEEDDVLCIKMAARELIRYDRRQEELQEKNGSKGEEYG